MFRNETPSCGSYSAHVHHPRQKEKAGGQQINPTLLGSPPLPQLMAVCTDRQDRTQVLLKRRC